MRNILHIFLKGAWIGGTLSVPGVSGGTMAILVGIYEQLIQSVNVLFKRNEKKGRAFGFLCIFSAGALSGIWGVSAVMVRLLEKYPQPMAFLFAGAVMGGIPALRKEANSKGFGYKNILSSLLGIIIVLFLGIVPHNFMQESMAGVGLQLLGGFISGVALVLPGISVSHMLLVLGIYDELMSALSRLDIIPVLPFALGIIIGIIASARLIEYVLLRYRTVSYHIILGFVMGSVFELLLGAINRGIDWMGIPLFIIGYCGVYLIFKRKKE